MQMMICTNGLHGNLTTIGKLVHLHAMYTKTGIFAVCKYNTLRDPVYMPRSFFCQAQPKLKLSWLRLALFPFVVKFPCKLFVQIIICILCKYNECKV